MANDPTPNPRSCSWWVVYDPDEKDVFHRELYATRGEAERAAEEDHDAVGLIVGRLIPVSEVRQICVEVPRGD